MSTTVRDPWADAWVAATQRFPDAELVVVRRRLWRRRALRLVLGGVALLGAYLLVNRVLDPDLEGLWSVSLHVLWFAAGLAGVGLILLVVGAVRTTGAARPFVVPDAFLPATDRAWLRARIAGGRAVPDGRHAVAADAARRMTVEGRYVPAYLGLALFYVGLIVGGTSLGTLVTFSVLVVCMLVQVVRAVVWSARGRRWLALHGSPGTAEK